MSNHCGGRSKLGQEVAKAFKAAGFECIAKKDASDIYYRADYGKVQVRRFITNPHDAANFKRQANAAAKISPTPSP
jgi:hypothetical protein